VFRETVGGGATFIVTLPRGVTPAALPDAQPQQIHAAEGALAGGD